MTPVKLKDIVVVLMFVSFFIAEIRTILACKMIDDRNNSGNDGEEKGNEIQDSHKELPRYIPYLHFISLAIFVICIRLLSD